MDVRLHDDARAELDAAGEWYEARRRGLGQVFAEEVARALDVIAESPDRWPLWPGVTTEPPTRRFVLWSFPFALAFLALQDRVVVLAIAHTSRRPGYWAGRQKP